MSPGIKSADKTCLTVTLLNIQTSYHSHESIQSFILIRNSTLVQRAFQYMTFQMILFNDHGAITRVISALFDLAEQMTDVLDSKICC